MKKWLMLFASVSLLAACSQTNDPVLEHVDQSHTQVERPESHKSPMQESTLVVDLEASDQEEVHPLDQVSSEEVIQRAHEYADQGHYDKADHILSEYERVGGDQLTANEARELNQTQEAVLALKVDRARQSQADQVAYAEVRESSVRREAYELDQGQPIDQASDQEIGQWLDQRGQEKAQLQASSQEVSPTNPQPVEVQPPAPVEVESPTATDSPASQTLSGLDLESHALEQVARQTGNLSSDYTYFTETLQGPWVVVEIRELQSDGEVSWTSMIGMYRYNVETGELLTFDPLTNEYK